MSIICLTCNLTGCTVRNMVDMCAIWNGDTTSLRGKATWLLLHKANLSFGYEIFKQSTITKAMQKEILEKFDGMYTREEGPPEI